MLNHIVYNLHSIILCCIEPKPSRKLVQIDMSDSSSMQFVPLGTFRKSKKATLKRSLSDAVEKADNWCICSLLGFLGSFYDRFYVHFFSMFLFFI